MENNKKNSSEVIKAFIRIRPPISNEINNEICLYTTLNKNILLKTEKYNITCNYDYIFNELSTQEEVFQHINSLLDDVLYGYNACIFAYGQTSAGKTHTMLGPNGGQDFNISKSDWGVIPRASEYLFNHLQERSQMGGFKYIAKASFFQIYNEKLYDLLRSNTDDTELKIREIPHHPQGGGGNNKNDFKKSNSRKNFKSSHQQSSTHNKKDTSNSNQPCEVYITGLSEFRVQTTDDILRVIRVGTHSRSTRSTNSNLTSSRSHAILQITFDMESKEENGQTILYKSKLSLVDLAGSEKMVALGNVSVLPSSEHLKELTAINQSLSSLGNVISALASKNRSHIPYRDSKLTRILQDSLGGNTRTILLSCVTPSILHAAETISTLQFTDRAKNVLIKSKANLVIDDKALLSNAQAEISRLKLLLKQALMKIESMGLQGNDTNHLNGNSTHGGSGGGSSLKLEDGETKEEMEKVIRENKNLRKENQLLIKELKELRESEELRRRREKERDRERDREKNNYIIGRNDDNRGGGGKKQWNLMENKYYIGDDKRAKRNNNNNNNNNNGGKERRGRKETIGLPAVQRSQTSPVDTSAPFPVQHPPPSNANYNKNDHDSSTLPKIQNSLTSRTSSTSHSPETISIPLHRQYKIREALGLETPLSDRSDENPYYITPTPPPPASLVSVSNSHQSQYPSSSVAIGSPSKSSLEKIRQEYFQQSEQRSPSTNTEQQLSSRSYHNNNNHNNNHSEDNNNNDEEDDDDDGFDVKKLRDQVQKAKDSVQLKEVEKTLQDATKNIVSQLEIDERSLADIQRSRKELEKQLQQLQMTEDNDQDDENENNNNNHIIQSSSMNSLSPSISTSASFSVSAPSGTSASSNLSPTSSSKHLLARQNSISRLKTREEFQNEVNKNKDIDLKYDKSDIGKRIELYIYRYNCWEAIELVDFDVLKGLHKCRHLDKTEQWIDLKKKQIKSLSEGTTN